MKKYEVIAEFWRKGNLVPVGTVLTLSKAEAKYIGHVVSEVKEVAPAPALVQVADAAPADESAEGDEKSRRKK